MLRALTLARGIGHVRNIPRHFTLRPRASCQIADPSPSLPVALQHRGTPAGPNLGGLRGRSVLICAKRGLPMLGTTIDAPGGARPPGGRANASGSPFLDPARIEPSRGAAYRASVQLSENANAQVLKGRPSRSFGHGWPAASTPFRDKRAPRAGIRTVHTP